MEDHELQAINPREAENNTQYDHDLPKVDGGLSAWLVLASVFVQGALIWGMNDWQLYAGSPTNLFLGFVYGFGVFQEYYSRQEQFAGHTSGLASIGTTASVSQPRMYPIAF